MNLLLRDSCAKLATALSPRRKMLAALRAAWAQPGAKYSYRTSAYFDLVRHKFPDDCVDDKTWVDLEFPAILSRLDTTVTPLGSQFLYRKLREYVNEPHELRQQYALYDELRSDGPLREEIQLKLAGLQDESYAEIAGILLDDFPEALKHQVLLWFWGLSSLLTLVAVIALSWSVWIWLAMLAVNVLILWRTYWSVHRDANALMSCLQMMKVADQLASMHKRYPSLAPVSRLKAGIASRSEMRKLLRWLSVLKSPVTDGVFRLLNVAFLTELIAFARVTDRFYEMRSTLLPTFEAIGSLDAAISIASYLDYSPSHCQPTIVENLKLDISDGRHPLLVDPVSNSIRLEQRSALITGSNMAGKTTFIKMVGINIILGRTMGFCLASQAIISRSRVMASIRGDHSVETGKSHYFAEIETIHSFIDVGHQRGHKVFIIDELFNGTNTVERVAAARAVLEALCRNALVLVTTHDVELQACLADRYELFHFQEEPEVEGFFDYRLRFGAATERNAIRLLGRMGFPADVIANALNYAAQAGSTPISRTVELRP